MSQSGFDVMQKQDKDAPVTWEAYEGLRDHLTGMFTKSADAIDTNVQAVQLKVAAPKPPAPTIHQQLAAIQQSIQQMTASVAGIQAAIVLRQPDAQEDDGSVHGDNAAMRGNQGRGRAQGPVRQPPLGFGARRLPIQEEDV